MKIKFLLSLFFFFSLSFGEGWGEVFSQNPTIDSLLTLIKTDKPDTNKVNHLNILSQEYNNIGEYDTGLKYGNKALALARSLPEIYDTRGRKIVGWPKGIAFAYNNIGNIYLNQGNYSAALKNYSASLKIAEETGGKGAIANAYCNIGNIYGEQGNYIKALRNYSIALKIFEDLNVKQGIVNSYINIGSTHLNQANYPEALKNYLIALKINEKIGNKQNIAIALGNIGSIHRFLGNYPEALKNQLVSLKISEEIKDKQGAANTYNNIGNIYLYQGNYHEALKNHLASLEIRKEINDKLGISMSYNNIGTIYFFQGNYQKALKNHLASLKVAKEIGDMYGIAGSYNSLGDLKIKSHKLKEAKDYFNMALQLSLEINSKEDIKNSYIGLIRIDSMQSNWKAAYQHHKLFIIYRDRIDNEESKKKIIQSTMTYEFEKKEAEAKAEQDKKDTIAAANKKKQQIVLALVSCVLVLILVFAGLIFRSLRVTKKQKIVIEEKNKLVEEKNKDIIDSINYAKRIQDALLKEQEHVNKHLPDHFILFKPKDIVSGDFYWSHEKIIGNGQLAVGNKKNENKNLPTANSELQTTFWYLAAVDCTGHGVPGAFMSMLGIAFLNEITATNQLLSPAEILDQLRNKVVKELGQSGKAGQSKDGMDISLMRLNLETRELQWAGANNPLWVIRKIDNRELTIDNGTSIQHPTSNNQHLIKIKPNKQPIGYHLSMHPFTNHVIMLEAGTSFYLFTDGYADQFGGEKDKKFMYSKLKELLLSIQDKPMPEQKEILNTTFENWKGNLEQVDDVTIIGIRIL